MRALVLVVLTALLLGMPRAGIAGYRIAVLPFTESGQGSGFEGIGLGLQSMVTTDLSQAEAITVVERARLKEILAEMDLAARGLVDPTTAVKVGRLANATHVVTGSFAAVGDNMRLDARLAHVETGKVEVGREIVGPTEEFFDLEKQVVNQLITWMGAELSAKERHRVNTVQSFDFDNFRKFSRGVALFDSERYDESVQLLEQVARTEPGFTLANVTLDDIRTAKEVAQSRASAARIRFAEEAFVVYQAEARQEAEWVSALRKIGTDPSQDWRDRTVANIILGAGLANLTNGGGFHAIKKSADEFALKRLGERAYQRIWNELRPKVPDWYPAMRYPSPFLGPKYDLDYVMSRSRDYFFDGTNANYLFSSCERTAHTIDDDLFEALWVPKTRQADLHRELLLASKGCMKARVFRDAITDLAERYRRLGQLGQAAAILTTLAASEQDPSSLDSIARDLAQLESHQKMLDAFPADSIEHEAIRFAPGIRMGRSPDPSDFQRGSATERAHYYLRNEFPLHDPLYINGQPVWLITEKEDELSTGRRTAPDESRSLRHYRDLRKFGRYPAKPEGPTLLIFGGVPRSDLTMQVNLNFGPASDWWPRTFSAKPEGFTVHTARPTAGLIIGLTEIETKPICDPADETKMTPVPTTGIAAVVHEGDLMLVHVEETWEEPDNCRLASVPRLQGLALKKVLARQPMRKRSATLEVIVSGSKITARAAGARVSATLPEPPTGFVGLLADGEGYVELGDPEWE